MATPSKPAKPAETAPAPTSTGPVVETVMQMIVEDNTDAAAEPEREVVVEQTPLTEGFVLETYL